MSINDKVNLLLKERKLNPHKIAKASGVDRNTIVGYLEKNNTINKVDFFIWLKREFPELNLNWLIADEGEQWLPKENQFLEPSTPYIKEEKLKALENRLKKLEAEKVDRKKYDREVTEIRVLLKELTPRVTAAIRYITENTKNKD